jgi:hypothetical protein
MFGFIRVLEEYVGSSNIFTCSSSSCKNVGQDRKLLH